MNGMSCSVDGCDRAPVARGICATCYARLRRHGQLPPKPEKPSQCSVEGCERAYAYAGYCTVHYRRMKKTGTTELLRPVYSSDEERFWSKVDKSGDCWLWTGALRSGGYGHWWANNADLLPHRYAYEVTVGPIPDGMQLDHLCRVRHCCNPAHLEPVSQRENNLRSLSPSAENAVKTHCKWGHEFTPENTYRPPKKPTSRHCRACAAQRYEVKKRSA